MPIFYILSFRGKLRTPFGPAVVENKPMLRALAYGVFKTHFCYLKTLRGLFPTTRSFPTVVDVGANVGDFIMAMSQNSERLVAIEPSPENYQTLRSNIRLNKIDNAVLLQLAAHDRDELVGLVGINSNLRIRLDKVLGARTSIGKTIDNIMKTLGIGKVSVIKIDVQGHEKSVLIGMKGLLRKHAVALVIVELHRRRGIAIDDIKSLLEPEGFRLVHSDDFMFDQPQLYFSDGSATKIR